MLVSEWSRWHTVHPGAPCASLPVTCCLTCRFISIMLHPLFTHSLFSRFLWQSNRPIVRVLVTTSTHFHRLSLRGSLNSIKNSISDTYSPSYQFTFSLIATSLAVNVRLSQAYLYLLAITFHQHHRCLCVSIAKVYGNDDESVKRLQNASEVRHGSLLLSSNYFPRQLCRRQYIYCPSTCFSTQNPSDV